MRKGRIKKSRIKKSIIPIIQNFNKILNDKFEINKTKDDMKNIINAVEAFDFIVKNNNQNGYKIGTNKLKCISFT